MSLIKDNSVEHIRKIEEKSEFQAGFTIGRRLEDNLFLSKYCVELSYKKRKPLIVMTINFVKAIDSVNKETLMWHWCDPMLIDLIVEICTPDHTDIFKGDVNIGRMEVNNGIWQGCTGSPQLFVTVMNTII